MKCSAAGGEPFVLGDGETLQLVKAALALVPTVVGTAVRREVAFVSAAGGSWAASARFDQPTSAHLAASSSAALGSM